MSLRSEIREEIEDEEFRRSQNMIIEKYYHEDDTDFEMHGFGWAILHNKFIGEKELSKSEEEMMKLELRLNALKHGRD